MWRGGYKSTGSIKTTTIARDGVYHLGGADDIKVQLTLKKEVEELASTKSESTKGMEHVEYICNICNLKGHTTLNCLTLPS